MKELKPHPLAEIFPSMGDGEFGELCDSIYNNGQRDPIVLLDGMILDGRHRYKVCLKVGVDAITENLPAGRDPVKFVIDKNLMRRQLTTGQRAAAIVKLREWQPAGRPKKTSPTGEVSREQLAAEAGVSPRTIDRAKRQAREERGEVDPKPESTEPSRTEKQQMEMDALRERAERAEADGQAAASRAEQMEALAAKVLADEPEESLKTKIWNEGVGAQAAQSVAESEAHKLSHLLEDQKRETQKLKRRLGGIKNALLRGDLHADILAKHFNAAK